MKKQKSYIMRKGGFEYGYISKESEMIGKMEPVFRPHWWAQYLSDGTSQIFSTKKQMLDWIKGWSSINENPTRCWKGYEAVMGKPAYSKGSCRKVRGNPARQPDEAVARELFLFIENDEILLTRRYPQFILNLERKMKRGVYDRERAVKLFMYLADEASKRYSKQFGDGKTHTADVPTRMLLAKMLRDRFESERRAIGIPAGAMPRTNPSCGVTMNPVRTKTWKLGENGGNIKANVNESGTAVQIIVSANPIKQGAYGRLFRWPLDRSGVDEYLNNFTTSYYSSKIIEWVESVTKGTRMNPAQSFSDFREFLSETLIPDLRESGMDSTADDFESAVKYLTYGRDRNYPKWKTFITKTLVPDLRESGYKETAKDFMTAVKFIDAGRRVVNKNAFSSESDRMKGYDDDRDEIPDKPLFKSGGYAVVITFKSGEVEIGQGISQAQAERQRKYLMKQYARLKLTRGINNVLSIEVLPVTSVAR